MRAGTAAKIAAATWLALCLVSVEAQRRPRRGRGRGQARRRGREEAGAAGGYSAPVPVYGGAGDAGLEVYGAGDDPLAALSGSIPGVPGEDYPIYAEDPYSLNDEIAAERGALAGASDQAQYGAPAEYG